MVVERLDGPDVFRGRFQRRSGVWDIKRPVALHFAGIPAVQSGRCIYNPGFIMRFWLQICKMLSVSLFASLTSALKASYNQDKICLSAKRASLWGYPASTGGGAGGKTGCGMIFVTKEMKSNEYF